MKQFLIAAAVCLFVVGCTALEISIWDECLDKNSFFYCMRTLHK